MALLSIFKLIWSNKTVVLLGVIVVLIGLMYAQWQIADKKRKGYEDKLGAKSIVIQILNQEKEQYKDDSLLTVTKMTQYETSVREYNRTIAGLDSIQTIMDKHLKAMDLKLKSANATIATLRFENEVNGEVDDIDSIIGEDTLEYNKEIIYTNLYDSIHIKINSLTWKYNLKYRIDTRLYVVSNVKDKIKYQWRCLGINWNIFGFGKRVRKLHIKSENPNSSVDRVFTVKFK